MVDTFHCLKCDSNVKITKVRNHFDHTERILSCGHKSRLFVRTINETTNLSESVSVAVTKFSESKQITAEEKHYDGVNSLQLSGDGVTAIINNSNITINVNTPDVNDSKNISITKIIEGIERLKEDINSSSINVEEKQKALSLFKKLKMIISPVSDFKEMISQKKWVFTMATPYILKLIEILFK